MNGISFALAPSSSIKIFWDDVSDSASTCFAYMGACGEVAACRCENRSVGGKGDEGGHKLKGLQGNGMRPDVRAK